MRPVFFYVQHLWGVGHVYRAARIASGLKDANFEVHLVWGGTQVPGFDLQGVQVHHLTPVRSSDASFSELLHADGRVFTEKDKEARTGNLLGLFDRIKPDLLITEAFPFGRRQMRFELLPLLERAVDAVPRPKIVSSIRDIMQEGRKPSRVEESNKLISDFFDLVLVHGDPELIKIEETLQGTSSFADKIRYTGLVTPSKSISTANDQKYFDVLASVGGGAFGRELLDCVLTAARNQSSDDEHWLVSAGSQFPEDEFQRLLENTPANVELVRHITDMPSTMASAGVSISHAGYNTVADILVTGCKAILYPYTGGRETEQERRADRLSELGLAQMIEPGTLSPSNLLAAIKTAKESSPNRVTLNLEGARDTARILQRELG